MKKLKSNLVNMTVVLTGISVIAGGALAYVNEETKGPIAEINERNLQNGIKQSFWDRPKESFRWNSRIH